MKCFYRASTINRDIRKYHISKQQLNCAPLVFVLRNDYGIQKQFIVICKLASVLQ